MRVVKFIFDNHILIPGFFLAVYFSLPTALTYNDGLDFAAFLERTEFGIEGIHPHHPLFLPLMWILYAPFKAANSLDALRFLQIMSAISGACSIWLSMKLFENWGISKNSAAVSGFFIGSSFAFWHFATDASAYIPTLCTTLLAMLLIFNPHRFTLMRAFMSALIFAIAVLMHEIAMLPLAATVYFLVFNPDKSRFPLKSSIAFIGLFSIVTIFTLIIGYLAAKSILIDSPVTFRAYLFSHADNRYFWTAFNINIRELVNEVVKAHTHLFFRLRPHEWYYYDSISGDTTKSIILYRAFTILSALAVFGSVLISRKLPPEPRHLMNTHFLWLILVFTFTVFFMPSNFFYRLFYIVPLTFLCLHLVVNSLKHYKKLIRPTILSVTILYYMFTLTTGILNDIARPSQPHPNPFYSDAMMFNEIVSENDLIIFAADDRYRTKYYRYFGVADSLRVTARIAYLDYWEHIWVDRYKFSDETRNYLSENYDRILISAKGYKQGEEFLLLGTYNFGKDCPDVMMIDKEDLVLVSEVLSSIDVFYWTMLQ